MTSVSNGGSSGCWLASLEYIRKELKRFALGVAACIEGLETDTGRITLAGFSDGQGCCAVSEGHLIWYSGCSFFASKKLRTNKPTERKCAFLNQGQLRKMWGRF
jgi:hypothetical protein